LRRQHWLHLQLPQGALHLQSAPGAVSAGIVSLGCTTGIESLFWSTAPRMALGAGAAAAQTPSTTKAANRAWGII